MFQLINLCVIIKNNYISPETVETIADYLSAFRFIIEKTTVRR